MFTNNFQKYTFSNANLGKFVQKSNARIVFFKCTHCFLGKGIDCE